ncbi:MAG TPA: hypothetical protein VFS39_12540 [Nitrospira sp.]|nr:hypothetical protein [Nitrospira sp.]
MAQADREKITAIRAYFEDKFPGWSIAHHYDVERNLEVFAIEGGVVPQCFTVKITPGFLDSYKAEELPFRLHDWQVGDFVKVSGLWPILVSESGLRSLR